MELRFAQVNRFYPHLRVAEITLCDNGCRLQNVPVLSGMVTSDTGMWTGHAMRRPPSEEEAGGLFSEEETLGPDFRSVMCVVAYSHSRAMIIGFLPHPLTQMAFIDEEQNRDIYRHPSGTNVTANKYGDLTIQQTGGAFIKIAWENGSGQPPDYYEDLTEKTANETWELQENEPATITITTGNRDGEAFKLRVRPSGDVDQMSSGYWHLRHARDLHHDIGEESQVHIILSSTHTAGEDIKIRTPANVTVTAGGDATVQAAGDAHLFAAGTALVAAGGDARVSAAGSATVGALGEARVGSAGPVTVASMEAIFLAAPVIVALTEEFIVTGSIIEGGSIAGIAGAAAAEAKAAEIVAQASIDTAAAVDGPPPELAEAAADLAEAAEEIELAVEEAVETSSDAVGTAPPDNEGLTGDPAPDMPIV